MVRLLPIQIVAAGFLTPCNMLEFFAALRYPDFTFCFAGETYLNLLRAEIPLRDDVKRRTVINCIRVKITVLIVQGKIDLSLRIGLEQRLLRIGLQLRPGGRVIRDCLRGKGDTGF